MPHVSRFVRSVVRIFVATAVVTSAGLAVLGAALRQPAWPVRQSGASPRARAELLRSHVEFLAGDVRPRSVSHPKNLDRAADFIATLFRAAGARTSIQRFDAREQSYSNVVAEFGPKDTEAPLLVIGAHYDAFAETGALPGADDNASGVAGLLELARLLGSVTLRRPVMLVAYANEEPPFFGSESMGSAVHASRLAATKRPVLGMICLEMIGYYAPRQEWPNALFALLYPSRGDFIGVAGGWSDRELARTVKRGIAQSGGIRVVSFSGPRETSDASDHRNYWAQGWPAVMITDTAFLRNPNYHTVRDTADTLDYTRMARVVDGLLHAVVTIAG